MVKDGFYYVVFQGRTTVAQCINNKWTMCGNANSYDSEDFDYINTDYCIYSSDQLRNVWNMKH